ncbi:MAG TPA: hypothetical protein VGD40_17200 [Chryseosolibacter sp.]
MKSFISFILLYFILLTVVAVTTHREATPKKDVHIAKRNSISLAQ